MLAKHTKKVNRNLLWAGLQYTYTINEGQQVEFVFINIILYIYIYFTKELGLLFRY